MVEDATTDGDHPLDIKGADGNATVVENVLEMDIPGMHLKYRLPVTKSRTSCRGLLVAAEGTIPMAVWNAGDNGYNNILVGGTELPSW